MQIQVIDPHENGSVIEKLYSRIEKETNRTAVAAGAYGSRGLVTILCIRAEGGQREILVLGCDRNHIQAVLEWRFEMEVSAEFDDLVIHLVRRIRAKRPLADAG